MVMLATVRIGAIHSVVFAGFGAHALGDRIVASGSRLVFTADVTWRKGKEIDLKTIVDDALATPGHVVEQVIVLERGTRTALARVDGDGRVDLANSSADVIGSVARFLAEHGWRRGMPTHYAIEPPSEIIDRALLLVPDVVPSFSAAQMVERGARLDESAMQHEGPLALIELLNAEPPPHYVAGTQNFYALTRYNASSYYALAVIELGRAVGAIR